MYTFCNALLLSNPLNFKYLYIFNYSALFVVVKSTVFLLNLNDYQEVNRIYAECKDVFQYQFMLTSNIYT